MLPDASISKEYWDAIKLHFRPRGAMAPVLLRRKLYELCPSDGADMRAHLAEICKIVRELKSVRHPIDDKELATEFLSSLPTSFDRFILTLTDADLSKSHNLIERMLGEYDRRNQQHGLSGNNAAFGSFDQHRSQQGNC